MSSLLLKWPGEVIADGEMNQMALYFTHRIQIRTLTATQVTDHKLVFRHC